MLGSETEAYPELGVLRVVEANEAVDQRDHVLRREGNTGSRSTLSASD